MCPIAMRGNQDVLNSAKCTKRGELCSFSGIPAAAPSIPPFEFERNRSIITVQEAPKAPDYESIFCRKGPVSANLSAAYVLQDDSQDILRLIYNYGASTSKSISDSPDCVPIWRDVVPALAFKHDFLLSGVFSVSALHLGLLYPSALHSKVALHHHPTGLESFRRHLLNITSENVTALFAFACLVPVYAFGSRNLSFSALADQINDPLVEIIDLFTLLGGIAIIIEKGNHWLMESEFAPFLRTNPAYSPSSSSSYSSSPGNGAYAPLPLAPAIEETLTILTTQNNLSTPDARLRASYHSAIKDLRCGILRARERPNAKMVVLPCPIMLKKNEMDEMRKKSPMALVVLAHYGVLLHSLRRDLWMRGWGRDVILAVRREVDWGVWGRC
ncbi:hypothetical protein BKA61DRAFT_650949 [Leptodontidium sp. MPI-SDFR-AT-0119]|nr:hypothetical protein BKA61DRAFT_650949 [Leptodontidium sp. MPI-SDFR-AT-0119]